MRTVREAWGKTNRDGDGTHPLAHHCMDVAAVFARMVQLPIVRDRLETAAGRRLTDVDCQRLSVLVFLHDIGKLHPGFQAKGWPHELWPNPRRGHLKEGWAFLKLAWKWPEHPFHETMLAIMKWGEVVPPLLAAALAHHGEPVDCPPNPTLADWDRPRLSHYDWRAEAEIMRDALHSWFKDAFESRLSTPLPDTPQLHHAAAGLMALADWIGSDTRFFPYTEPFAPGYDSTAHKAAAHALRTIRLDISAQPAPAFAELTGFPEPKPAQATVGKVGPEARLVILEAETGSGKTEAALWRFTQLFAAGKVSGLYFAVPTRAAAKQLHSRVDKALHRAFGKQAPETVLAIPGMLRAGEFEGQRLPHWRVRWDDSESSAPWRWAAEHATRFLAAPVAVGTVDQAMLAGLQVKHAHLRGSALNRSLLVIDEVHASDAYMTEVLKQLTDGHLATGGYVMLMSATLGARARVRWTGQTPPDYKAAVATPYPAVWVEDEDAPRTATDAGRPKVVHPETVSTMSPAKTAEHAISAAEQGARVLVIRNTVTTAVATWRAVREAGEDPLLMQARGHPALHHSRFAVEDRALLDKRVETTLAPDPRRERQGCIVIGTQTLEQSLDIDADLLITDLCPMDVLLQRVGRLHRHNLPRPEGFEAARALVLLPQAGLDHLTEPAFCNGLGGWKAQDGGFEGIYRDLAGLELTRRLIEKHRVWRIPEMNRALVEGATHPDLILALIEEKGENWGHYDRRFSGSEAAKAMLAKLNGLNRTAPYGEEFFPDSNEQIMTRLGEEGAILSLDPPPEGPFGQPVTRIALPARWSRGIMESDRLESYRDEADLVLSVGERHFRYSREGLAKIS